MPTRPDRTPVGSAGLATAVAVAILAAAPLSCRRSEEADPQQVVVYCSVDKNTAEPILAAFEKRTGIRVLARFDDEATKTTGLVQRIRAESAHPAADVFWSGEIFYTIRLAQEGMLAPYRGSGADGWPARYCDAQKRWHAFGLRARAIAYDTRRVSADQAPRSLEDLFRPEWKGRLTMAEPQFGTTCGDVASWFAHYGPDRAREILRGLKANQVKLVKGNSTAVRAVATGLADVALTDTDDVYAAQRNGWPIAMNLLDQGGKGALAIPNTAALIRGGPHRQAAERLLAFILSEDVEIALAQGDSHNAPIRPHLAARFPKYALGEALDIGYEKVAEHIQAASSAGEILR